MRRKATITRDVFRLCRRFASSRKTNAIVTAARRLLLKERTPDNERQWITDVRLLCEVNLGRDTSHRYNGSGRLWRPAKRMLRLLEAEDASSQVVRNMPSEEARDITLTTIGAFG